MCLFTSQNLVWQTETLLEETHKTDGINHQVYQSLSRENLFFNRPGCVKLIKIIFYVQSNVFCQTWLFEILENCFTFFKFLFWKTWILDFGFYTWLMRTPWHSFFEYQNAFCQTWLHKTLGTHSWAIECCLLNVILDKLIFALFNKSILR